MASRWPISVSPHSSQIRMSSFLCQQSFGRAHPAHRRSGTMSKKLLLASATVLAFLGGTPAIAHHSANAELNTEMQMTLTGVLTKVENGNPQSWWYIYVNPSYGKCSP